MIEKVFCWLGIHWWVEPWRDPKRQPFKFCLICGKESLGSDTNAHGQNSKK